MKLKDEILAALDALPEWQTGYRIGRWIEDQRAADGRRSRFLLWTFRSIVPAGSIYNALDALRSDGEVERRERVSINGTPLTFVWRRTAR